MDLRGAIKASDKGCAHPAEDPTVPAVHDLGSAADAAGWPQRPRPGHDTGRARASSRPVGGLFGETAAPPSTKGRARPANADQALRPDRTVGQPRPARTVRSAQA